MKIHSNTRVTLFKQLNNNSGASYFLKKIPHNSIPNMIDIGANIGMISLMAKILHPEMRIFAFEPHPRTFEELNSNVDGMKISTFNLALGNGETFYLAKQRKMDLCNKFSVKEDVLKEETIKVQSLKIQDIFKKIKIKPEETLLKIDCEGAESFMVGDKDAENILRRTKMVAMETHGGMRVRTMEYISWFVDILSRSHVLVIDRHELTLIQMAAFEKGYFRNEFDK